MMLPEPVDQYQSRRTRSEGIRTLIYCREQKRKGKRKRWQRAWTTHSLSWSLWTFPPILHPHLSSVLKSGMIKSRFIDCVTWKNLQSFSKPNRFWFLDGKRGMLGISKRVCYACMNPSWWQEGIWQMWESDITLAECKRILQRDAAP